jgi:acyl-CoA synthetase (AMP-forming)/AMP-acid ligase II
MQNNIGAFLSKRAYLSPDADAYVDGASGSRLSFRALNARCNRLANALVASGVQKAERIGLLMMNSAEFMEAYFALAKIGAVVVPLNWRLVPNELEFILKDSGTTRLIYGEEFLDTVTELHARGAKTDVAQWLQVTDREPIAGFAQSYQRFRDAAADTEPNVTARDDDRLYIMYTSGTTGLPKGVVHTHSTAMWGVLTIAATTYYREHERYLACLPMFHVGALTPLTVNVYRGAASIVMRAFDPVRAWQLIESERITCGLCVPAMLNFMLQVGDLSRFDYSTLRWCMCGAAPVPEPLIEAYAKLGIEVHQIYGLTESCGPACLIDADHALKKIGSTGKAFFHTDIRVVSEAGKDCAAGEPGEVWVRGPHVMLGYWNRPEATAETIVNGWLRTGDVAVMDDDGYIFIQDRIKDMIISGGENVYPAEIENILMAHDGIAEAAVIGQPSAKWGESPFAIVVRKDGALAEKDVIEFCRGRLAGYKQPRGVAFVAEIPRNPSGKILKRVLRDRFPGPASV